MTLKSLHRSNAAKDIVSFKFTKKEFALSDKVMHLLKTNTI